MTRRGWFKESARHSLAARGVPTGRYASSAYFRRKRVARKFINIQAGVPKDPSVALRRAEFVGEREFSDRPATAKEVAVALRRRDVIRSKDGEALRIAEDQLKAAEQRLAGLSKDADEDRRKALQAEVKEKRARISSMLDISNGNVKIRAQASEFLEGAARRSARARKLGGAEVAPGASERQKSVFENLRRRQSMEAASVDKVPRKGSVGGKEPIREVLKRRQEREESARRGREESIEKQRPKKFERVEFDDVGDEGEE